MKIHIFPDPPYLTMEFYQSKLQKYLLSTLTNNSDHFWRTFTFKLFFPQTLWESDNSAENCSQWHWIFSFKQSRGQWLANNHLFIKWLYKVPQTVFCWKLSNNIVEETIYSPVMATVITLHGETIVGKHPPARHLLNWLDVGDERAGGLGCEGREDMPFRYYTGATVMESLCVLGVRQGCLEA